MSRTEREICETAYAIQDAINFYPVIMELSKTVQELRTLNTPDIKAHPAVIILIDKLNQLIGIQFYNPDAITKLLNAMSYCSPVYTGYFTPPETTRQPATAGV